MALTTLERCTLRLSGENLKPWLEGLITNNLSAPLTFAALLTPQGKIIADFFIHQDQDRWGDDLLIETAPKFNDILQKRLKIYKLREKIDITDVSAHLQLYALWDGTGELGPIDPRHAALGQRFLSGDKIENTATPEAYDDLRLSLSIPDSQYDFDTSEMFPADVNMDLLSGVDFKKGCFIGQEVVSRMKRKTTVRKRMRAVTSAEALAPGPITAAERVIGECLYSQGQRGIALIRLDRLDGHQAPLMNNGASVEILTPDYI